MYAQITDYFSWDEIPNIYQLLLSKQALRQLYI